MIDLIQLTGSNVSIYIILIGALLLYFGKIIGDTKVGRYDKLGYYIEGLFFFAIFVFIPSLLAYYVKNLLNLSLVMLYFVQLVILGCLSWNFRAHYYFRKHGLVGKLQERLKQELDQIKNRPSTFGFLVRTKEEWFKSKFGVDFVEFNILAWYKIPIKIFGDKKVLFLFSFVAILSSFYVFETGNLLFFGTSIIFTVFILTMIATAYGFGDVYYPPAKIHMEKGEFVEGTILKFGDFIYLLKGDRKIFVNKDKVTYIEESLFKEKSD
jgi:hypothetical protein